MNSYLRIFKFHLTCSNMFRVSDVIPKMIFKLSSGSGKCSSYFAVADPGFPIGGHGPRRGVWTPEAVMF